MTTMNDSCSGEATVRSEDWYRFQGDVLFFVYFSRSEWTLEEVHGRVELAVKPHVIREDGSSIDVSILVSVDAKKQPGVYCYYVLITFSEIVHWHSVRTKLLAVGEAKGSDEDREEGSDEVCIPFWCGEDPRQYVADMDALVRSKGETRGECRPMNTVRSSQCCNPEMGRLLPVPCGGMAACYFCISRCETCRQRQGKQSPGDVSVISIRGVR